jgi:outer membrane lipoprotein carrier protein
MAIALLAAHTAWATTNGVETLREFVRDARSGQAQFTQTVTSADGVRKKTSSGTFEFLRPNRFRFHYLKPFEQVLVADGAKVWMHDPELNQVSARKLDQVLGSTPAALLAGGSLDKDFELTALSSRDGLEWVQAVPRQKDGTVQSVRVAFKGKSLAVLEMTDSFGQKSTLQFVDFALNPPLAAQTFKFVPPRGADVVEQ